MFTSQQFREKAAEYVQMAKGTEEPGAVREFQRLERSYTDLANNDEWLASNFDRTIHPTDKDSGDDQNLSEEEGDVLRCLGAAVVMRWNTIPTKLQRELFDSASSIGASLTNEQIEGGDRKLPTQTQRWLSAISRLARFRPLFGSGQIRDIDQIYAGILRAR